MWWMDATIETKSKRASPKLVGKEIAFDVLNRWTCRAVSRNAEDRTVRIYADNHGATLSDLAAQRTVTAPDIECRVTVGRHLPE